MPAFVGANTVAAAMNFVGLGTVFAVTVYLQVVQHRTALLAGLAMVPLFAPLAMLSPVAGRLTAAYGPAVPMVAGLLVGAVGTAGLWLLSPTSGYVLLLPTLLGLGVGMGLLTAAVVAAALRAVPADRGGLAGGVNNTARQAAGALGVAVFGAVAGSPARPLHFVAGLHRLGVLGAVLWLAAAALTVVTTRRTAAATTPTATGG